MKQTIRTLILLCLGASPTMLTGLANAQQTRHTTSGMQFFRPNDQRGVNVFETERPILPIQRHLHPHRWSIRRRLANPQGPELHKYKDYTEPCMTLPIFLQSLVAGFQLGWANMYLDGQLADGIRTNVTRLSCDRSPRGYVGQERILADR